MTLSGDAASNMAKEQGEVLIPLLVDDPLWEGKTRRELHSGIRLNPSFSG